MARIIEAKCRHCRRSGKKLFLKGSRCYTAKCAVEKNPRPPGKKGKRGRITDYGIHLREVQVAKQTYGLTLRQLKRLYYDANRLPGDTGVALTKMLESRLDNVLFMLGFALSRAHARQMIVHGHVRVNGKKVSIPSVLLKAGNTVGFKNKDYVLNMVRTAMQVRGQFDEPPTWLRIDSQDPPTATVLQEPDVKDTQVKFDSRLIVEFLAK